MSLAFGMKPQIGSNCHDLAELAGIELAFVEQEQIGSRLRVRFAVVSIFLSAAMMTKRPLATQPLSMRVAWRVSNPAIFLRSRFAIAPFLSDAVPLGVPGNLGLCEAELVGQSLLHRQPLVTKSGERSGGAAELAHL
jgi:hypothetical protein